MSSNTANGERFKAGQTPPELVASPGMEAMVAGELVKVPKEAEPIPRTRGGRHPWAWARSVQAWRASFAGNVMREDIEATTRRLVEAAVLGKPWAVRELLDRCVGPAGERISAEQAGAGCRLRIELIVPGEADRVRVAARFGQAVTTQPAALEIIDQAPPGAGAPPSAQHMEPGPCEPREA